MDRSANWIGQHYRLGPGQSVVDFGCGPGLYTSRLVKSGAQVTGLDFSERSIAYARDQARLNGLGIDYTLTDYLTYETTKKFDLILMIMCDYSALGPHNRSELLDKWRGILKPDGALLFDVHALPMFHAMREELRYSPNLLDGFWSDAPYHGFLRTFKYEHERVSLDKYTIVEASRTRTVYNWLQYFDPESLGGELAEHGFILEQIFGDVAGAPYDPRAHEFAVSARCRR